MSNKIISLCITCQYVISEPHNKILLTILCSGSRFTKIGERFVYMLCMLCHVDRVDE